VSNKVSVELLVWQQKYVSMPLHASTVFNQTCKLSSLTLEAKNTPEKELLRRFSSFPPFLFARISGFLLV
jgi:hypothetical protein